MQRMKKSPKISRGRAGDEKAWPVEIETVKNVREGRVEMVVQSADELIAELKELENEP